MIIKPPLSLQDLRASVGAAALQVRGSFSGEDPCTGVLRDDEPQRITILWCSSTRLCSALDLPWTSFVGAVQRGQHLSVVGTDRWSRFSEFVFRKLSDCLYSVFGPRSFHRVPELRLFVHTEDGWERVLFRS